jgi:6,7-dimethyl-8-ribityllumazine synthase
MINVNEIDVQLKPKGKYAIIVARFNEFITLEMKNGALKTLIKQGVQEKDITVWHVPGAFEIGVLASKIAKSGKFDAIITLGAVIKGSTAHFDFVSGAVTNAVNSIGLETGVPTIFGVITVDTIEQAIERAGSKAGNKGSEAAITALEMVNILETV